MSGSDRDASDKRPPVAADGDDPWAKWRKPGEPATAPADKPARRADERTVAKPAKTVAPTVNPKNGSKSKMATPGAAKPERSVAETKPVGRPVAAANVPAPVNEDDHLVKPSGTLGMRKTATAQARPLHKKPARAGAVAKRPTMAEKAKAIAVEKPEVRPSASVEKVEKSAESLRGPSPAGVRLSKVMSERGLCSRREADLWIERGWVFVDGQQVSELGSRIDPSADISISKEAQKDQAKQVTILLHKPVGYVSGQPEPGMQPAVTLITPEAQVVQSGDPEFKPWMLRGLAPAGRLDVDSTGLLVLTSDGRVAKRLIGEDSDAEKEYLVRVSGEMIRGGLDLLRHGLELDGKPLKQAWVKQLNEDQLHFILKEGKKRQIRRMCELVGLRVVGLKRVRIGRIRLGDLPMGQWRFLRADEAF